MSVVILGIVSSIFTSLVKWMNTRLTDTPLSGKGAEIVAIIVSFIGSIIFLWYKDMLDFSNKMAVVTTFSVIYTTANLWYKWVVEKFFTRN